MFKFLKEKISKWAKKVSKETEKIEVEEPIKEQIKDTLKDVKEVKKVEKKEKKKEKKLEKKKAEKEVEKKKKEKLKKKVDEVAEVPVEEKKNEVEKEVEEVEKKPEKKKGFFEKIASKMSISKVIISEKDFEVYSEELEMLLLENNVALEVAEKIIKELKERIVGKELLKKEVEFVIKDSLTDIIREILLKPTDLVEEIRKKLVGPYVVLFCGINGTGKTTSIAKIAH